MLVFLTMAVDAAEVAEVDSARHQDPKLDLAPEVTVYSPRLEPLWLEALRGPEVELRRQAAQTIAMAHREGMPGLADTAAPLVEAMAAPDQHPVVVLAAAQALVAIDARHAAPQLHAQAKRVGGELAEVVEPALAAWDYRPIRDVWLARLPDPETRPRALLLAIRGLRTVGERKAEPHLREMVLSVQAPSDFRLEAAVALASIAKEGLEDEARTLVAREPTATLVDRLVAASLLREHEGEAARELMLELAVDAEPAVAAIALGSLLEIDPLLVVPIAERTVESDDANVRRLGARSLVAWRTPEAVALLGPMLDDPHPDVRGYVRRSLVELASDADLAEPVIAEAVAMLATDRWRGLEQASLALVALDHKPAAGRLVELLEFERPEVFVTAAWALRRLAVPDTLDAMLDKARRQTKLAEGGGALLIDVDRQVAQLFEAFGQMRHAEAEPLMLEYVPKQVPFGLESRTAAIWGLGHLHAGEPEPDLVERFVGRLSDTSPMFPEAPEVRTMAAISLGRMRAEDALPTLRRFAQGDFPEVQRACAWALHEITGEPMPKLETIEIQRRNWFLDPID